MAAMFTSLVQFRVAGQLCIGKSEKLAFEEGKNSFFANQLTIVCFDPRVMQEPSSTKAAQLPLDTFLRMWVNTVAPRCPGLGSTGSFAVPDNFWRFIRAQ